MFLSQLSCIPPPHPPKCTKSTTDTHCQTPREQRFRAHTKDIPRVTRPPPQAKDRESAQVTSAYHACRSTASRRAQPQAAVGVSAIAAILVKKLHLAVKKHKLRPSKVEPASSFPVRIWRDRWGSRFLCSGAGLSAGPSVTMGTI